MRPEFLKFIRVLFKKAIKNQDACKIECSVNLDSKIREFIENWLMKNGGN